MNTGKQQKDFSIGNNQPVRLLIIANPDSNPERYTNALKQSGFNLKAAKISNIKELTIALRKYDWDMILSPVMFSGSKATEVSELIKQSNKDIPYLIIENDLGNSALLEALISGARDAVPTDNLDYFIHIIRRELNDLSTRREYRYYQTSQNKQSSADTSTSPLPDEQQTKDARQTSQNSTDTLPAKEQPPTVAQHDLLTNLYTEHYFLQQLGEMLGDNTGNTTNHGLIYIALDSFDALTASIGDATGNLVIDEVASILRGSLDETFPVARTGNAEFSVLAIDKTVEETHNISETIRRNLAKHLFKAPGKSIPGITCSIGINFSHDKTTNASNLLEQARLACQTAQHEGGNRLKEYSQNTVTKIDQKSGQGWEAKIRDALANNRFRLIFQPIVNLHKEPAENYEILLRMVDINNVDIPPKDFFPAAIQAGLVTAIDRWVISQTMSELVERCNQGKITNFFIKISDETLCDQEFPPWLITNIKNAKIPGNQLIFEIRETSASRLMSETINFLGMLKILHARCALEQFGAQKNSLEILNKLPVDFVKIDRSYIQNLAENPENKQRVTAIVEAAHEIGKLTIAEFVQDATSMSTLWQCNLDYIQGYFVQRPEESMSYDFTGE